MLIDKMCQENMPLFFIIALLTLVSACGILGSDEDNAPLDPGPRSYDWKIDSVYSAPGGWMNTIWGASPNNLWIGSAGGLDRLWHYNGTDWQKSSKRIPRSINTIFGFAQDNVWMGTNGVIYHYDGSEWNEFYTYQPEGMGEPNILDIWGTSSSDIYAVGTVLPNQGVTYRGFILHYDGDKWEELLVTDFGAQFQRVRKGKEGLIIRGSHRADGEPSTLSFFKYSDHQLKTLLSETAGEVETLWMNNVGEDIYYIVGNEIKQRRNRTFKTFLSTTENSTPIGINGRHEKDLFIVTENGVTHYNGQDYYTLVNLENEVSYVFRELVFERDIFFLVNDYGAGTNLIYHGTLTEEEQGE